MIISAIAAITKNRGLGKDNKLLFYIPGDLPRFKKITTGHPVIMGRKTFESIGRVLPNRTNIIVTRDPGYKVEGAMVVHNLEEALKKATSVISNPAQRDEKSPEGISSHDVRRDDNGEIFILGGGQIFTEALHFIDRLYLTVVDTEVPADAFFPDYSEFTRVIEREEKNDWEHKYQFLILERG